jgi:hypothetical protein
MKQKFRKMFLKLALEVPLFGKMALLNIKNKNHFGIKLVVNQETIKISCQNLHVF